MNQPRGHMGPPILDPLTTSPHHPIPLSCPRALAFECPASCTELALVIYFTYGNIYVSVLFSQIVPPLPSPTDSKSLFFTLVTLLVPYIKDCHLSKFHMYALIYSIFISFFWLTSFCIIGSSFIHLIRTDSNAFFFITHIPFCICTTISLSFICR